LLPAAVAVVTRRLVFSTAVAVVLVDFALL
jgi:hypothetical protein